MLARRVKHSCTYGSLARGGPALWRLWSTAAAVCGGGSEIAQGKGEAGGGEASNRQGLQESGIKKKRWKWKDERDLKEFLDGLKERCGVSSVEDWGKVSSRMVRASGGGGIFNAYGSLSAALACVYPEASATVRSLRWDTKAKRRSFLDEVARQLQLKDPMDWRSVTTAQVTALGGGALVRRCGNLESALKDAYGDGVKVPSDAQAQWKSLTHRQEFMKALGDRLGFLDAADWGSLTVKQVEEAGGWRLMQYYDYSLLKAIKETVGNEAWEAKRAIGLRRVWDCQETVRAFMDKVGESSGVAAPEDWLLVKKSELVQNGGARLLHRYGGNILEILSLAYPEVDWKDLERQADPFFERRETRRAFVLGLGKSHGATTAAQWLALKKEHFIEAGGAAVLKPYSGVYEALNDLLPEVDFSTAIGIKKPRYYWKDAKNVRAFMDRIAQIRGIASAEDWKKVGHADIGAAGGRGMLAHYDWDVIQLLRVAYPEQQWSVPKSRSWAPKGYWSEPARQREFLTEFADENDLQTEEDWAAVSLKDIADAGGKGLVRQLAAHNVCNLLAQVFPEKSFDQLAAIGTVPASYWSEETVRDCLEAAREELCIESKEEWARVSYHDIARASKATGRSVHKFLRHMRLPDALRIAYPHEDWSCMDTFDQGLTKKSSQRSLRVLVQRLFPQAEVLEDHLHQLERISGKRVELDLFVPSHALAFEYQGEQHYHEFAVFTCLDAVRLRDEEKRRLCDAEGIRLVEVPYWWDFSLPSLAATIHSQYPSLLHEVSAEL